MQRQSFWKKIIANPSLAVFFAYLFGILIGAFLLWLPISTHKGISFVDAIFTSASALCVTGLSVQDTGTCFTTLGQCVILLLIQFGGIGILTFSAFIIRLLSGHLDFKSKSWLEDSIFQNYAGNLYRFVKEVMILVFVVEAIGAFCLFWSFYPEYSFGKSIYLAIFHSISAFCNAGFSLFSNNLETYRGAIWLNFVVMFLIVAGGIGFMVIEDILAFCRKQAKFLAFHTKIVLVTSVIAVLIGFIATLLLEFSGSFLHMTTQEQLLASLFQSVSTRTAGFNTVPIGQLSSATLFVYIALMFMGGSPGSMAGGVKTTSVTILIANIFSRLQGRPCPEIFHRTVSPKYIERILILFITAISIITIAVFILLITENNSQYMQTCREPFLTILFEVASALGTVGLTMGITPELSICGKLIISMLMLIGRIGPLSLAIFLMSMQTELDYQYPEEEIMIG